MTDHSDSLLGPWNPGLVSRLPVKARPLATIFRPENSSTRIEDVDDRAAFTGLEAEALVAFRPERLIIHELLIRVTGDFSVPDGSRYADLGINFRNVVDTILKNYITPELDGIVGSFNTLRASIRGEIEEELQSCLFAKAPASSPEPGKSFIKRWLGIGTSKGAQSQKTLSFEDRERELLARWRLEATTHDDPKRRRLSRALAQVIGAISIKYGRVRGDLSVLTDLVTNWMMNDHGSIVVGELIEPLIQQAVEAEGYRLLPQQAEPVVMNVKGASAAGKSTLRPQQQQLANRLGINWADFALISPDIWRKYLLDYDSLGEFWRYAGTLTGHELQMIDQKLDRYMAAKARQGRMSHLLIDRFRFDSFAEEEGGEQGARLLTRFGATIYMFFVITPPDATVERAWKRGLEFGRFKAVDDLLHHNVEAFTGMPDLFFTWALRQDKRVHYEFLDNSVPLGERPRTIAFGWNGEMTILDIKGLIDVDRYRRIDIEAVAPDDVYPGPDDMQAEKNTEFLKQCLKLIHVINVTAPMTDKVMARIESGRLDWIDSDAAEKALGDPDMAAGLTIMAPRNAWEKAASSGKAPMVDLDQAHILGSCERKG